MEKSLTGTGCLTPDKSSTAHTDYATDHYAKHGVELSGSPSVTGLQQTEDGNAVEFGKEGWQAELRKVVCLKQCQIPSSSEIEVGGTCEQATITVKEKGLNENMQSDEKHAL